MHIELTHDELLRAQQGQPVDVIDPQTNEAYVLIAKPSFEMARSHLIGNGSTTTTAQSFDVEIPEGIRLSQEAFRRDLPELIKEKSLYHQWVAYHRNQRLGFAGSQRTLVLDCFERGLADDDFYVGWIDSCELEIDEEVEARPEHFVE